MLDESLIEQILMLVPAEQAARLLLLTPQERVTAAQWDRMLREALEHLDWGSQQERIGLLLSQLIPVDTLVPNRYRAWRPLVRDAVAFWGAHLPPSRLGPKLIEQILLPVNVPLAQRVTMFMAHMPSLQKIGQMMARNRHLDPAFRAELTRLENTIQDIAPVTIRAEIERQLGPQLITYAVTVEDVHLAEASVSAAVRFTWRNPATGAREQGVFKVLKPYVSTYLAEELALLQALADFLDVNRHRYTLPQVHVRELLDEVCHLLAAEVDLLQEQANLEAAAQRYACVTGVRVPRLIRALSTPTITAMTEEPGVKVTEAFAHVPWKRRQVATRLIEALLAIPLFVPEQVAVFHADPHAGNLFCNERTGEVILLDWALTQRLHREERHQLVRLILAVVLRDVAGIYEALAALSTDNVQHDPTQAAMVRRYVTRFVQRLPPWSFPGLADVMRLLDAMILTGLRFSPSLLILRKILFTLHGVLHDVAPGVSMEPVLAWYMLTQGTGSVSRLCLLSPPTRTFRSLLSTRDWMQLSWSALGFSSRVWRQNAAWVGNAGWQTLQSSSDTCLRISKAGFIKSWRLMATWGGWISDSPGK